MTTIIGVRFQQTGKVYYFNPENKQIDVGQHAIVETSRGIEYGVVVLANKEVEDETIIQPFRPVIRMATPADDEAAQANERHASEAFDICKKKILLHKLDMHLVSVECTFDLNKILFYFTADGRVDFRDLVKDLASVFRTRIELRQIGVRDEAKMLGGLGSCGRELCCSSYLRDFQPVSINMAKEQNLSLNPTKISGTCGRLMCCLKYEHEVYAELQKITPRPQSYVETPEGTGTVVSTQMLRGTCRVQLDDVADAPHVFSCEECRILRAAKGRTGKPCCRAQNEEAEGADAPRFPRTPRPNTGTPQGRAPQQPRAEIPRTAPMPQETDDSADSPRRRSHRGGRRRTTRKDEE